MRRRPACCARWVASAARLLKPQGVLTLIWRADALAEVLSALTAEFGGIAVLPVLSAPRRAGDSRAGARGESRRRRAA